MRNRTIYRYQRNPDAPSYQQLQAIDQSTPVDRVLTISKYDGDRVFSVRSVIRRFGPFEDIRRFTQPNDWVTLRRYPLAVRLR
jgi:hypothetical protein